MEIRKWLWITGLCLAAIVSTTNGWAADLTVSYTQPAQTAIDWDGIDDVDGDGTLTFASLGDTQAASLKVLCNSTNGYTITFNTANATGAGASEIINGGSAIPYTATLDTSGVANATVVTSSLVLNNVAQESVDVNFNGGSDVLPVGGASPANTISLSLTLTAFGGDLYPQGTYTDVITATIATN